MWARKITNINYNQSRIQSLQALWLAKRSLGETLDKWSFNHRNRAIPVPFSDYSYNIANSQSIKKVFHSPTGPPGDLLLIKEPKDIS